MNLKTMLAAFAAAGTVFAAWGAKISGERLALGQYRVFGGLTSDAKRPPATFKHGGIQVIHADGAVSLRLAETGREETEDAESKTVSIRFKDENYPFEVTRRVKTWRDCGTVETWVEIRHSESGAVRLIHADSTAMSLYMPNTAVRVMTLAGSWCDEGNISEAPVANGHIVELASRSGTRNAWNVNSAMMVSFGDGVDEEHGMVLGVALEWTGTSCRRIRRRYDGKETEIFAGVDMTSGPYTLDPGVTFTTPRAILVWTEKGRGEVSRQYHRWARRHLMPHGDVLHPVLLNSWEGSFFDFTETTLTDMMDGVAKMDGEMFVLDDGWFGLGKHARDEKNRDRAGLGDWCVNTNKLPHGLGWLADEAKRRGLQFGLWVEPEMANTRSDLATAHPEWLLAEANRRLICGRGGTQAVLDLTNGAVRDNLFGQLDTLYSSVPSLAYVKWDCNCDIQNLGSRNLAADRQPNLWYDYTMGLYEILARLKERHPGIMVQACASGGGHMDFGFLRYADEFWTSDCTDPYKRIFIQWGASQFYPASAMACHVTASPNIATKRVTPIKYRFDVAMTGRLGFELHPKDMTADEITFAKAAVADYKRIRPVVQRGDLYRLVSPYEKPLSALMYVGAERDAAVVFALGLKDFGEHAETLKLRGLNPVARYSVREINCGKRLHFADREDGGSVRTGRELMEKGIAVRLSGDYDSAVFELERLCADGARDEAYLFAYFSNNGHGGRKGEAAGMRLAYSYDAKNWTPLAGEKPFLVPTVGKGRLLRDPSICRGPDGTFHLVWTTGWWDKTIGHASSKDLVHWSEQQEIPVMAHEPAAKNCWAPEVTYNPEDGLFYIYWATTIPGRHSGDATNEKKDRHNHRIYLTTTKDWRTFTPARLWFNPPFSVIDAALFNIGGKWMMVVKNENGDKKDIRTVWTESLAAGWKSAGVPLKVTAAGTWVEGPSPLMVDDTLYIYFDRYTKGCYGAVKSTDGGGTWRDTSDEVSFPKGCRHGTAFAVQKQLVESLIRHSESVVFPRRK